MVEILSQAEIEALLSSLSGDGGGETDAPTSAAPSVAAAAPSFGGGGAFGTPHKMESRAIAYEVYDFRRPDKLSKDQLRTLQMLHETFGRLFASSLSAYLRVSTHIDLVSVEQIPYDEYMRSLTASIINVISLPPLTGQAILEMEFNVILSMMDRLLGGPGNMVKNNTILTEIEQALTVSIVDRALKEFKNAWEGIANFSPKRERLDTQAQFIQIVPPNDIVVSILFEVKVGDLRGAMSICLPYILLKPISSKLSAQRWLSTTTKKSSGGDAPRLAKQIATTSVDCICQLGKTQISVQELLELKVGDTVRLNRKETDYLDMVIGNRTKFRGKPAKSGRNLCMHINKVVSTDD